MGYSARTTGIASKIKTVVAEWHYIGHYGQLGPLTKEQFEELIDGGVITRETYVWKSGMSQWVPADSVKELQPFLMATDPYMSPPPPPMHNPQVTTRTATNPVTMDFGFQNPYAGQSQLSAQPYSRLGSYPVSPIVSNKSRVIAGILNIVFPGVGRMYLGYTAHGVLQLFLGLCTGVLWLWSIIDGIVMLSGGLQHDGYGRVLQD